MVLIKIINSNINLPSSHLSRKSQNTPNNPLPMAHNSFLLKMTSKAFRIRSRYRSPNSTICGQVCW
jgi:hypothetical protein